MNTVQTAITADYQSQTRRHFVGSPDPMTVRYGIISGSAVFAVRMDRQMVQNSFRCLQLKIPLSSRIIFVMYRNL